MSNQVAQLSAALDGKIASLEDVRFRSVYDLAAKAQGASIEGAEKLMELLRPRLRQMRLDRPKSWQRLVCLPFENLLADPAGDQNVPRALLTPLLREMLKRAEGINLSVLSQDAWAEISDLKAGPAAEAFFARAHNLAAGIFHNAQADKSARTAIFGAAAPFAGHGRLIVPALEAGPWLSAIQALRLPEPVQALAPSDIEAIIQIFATLKDKQPAIVRHVLDSFVRRFARPEALAPLLAGSTFKLSSDMRQQALAGIADTINGDLEKFTASFDETEVSAEEAITAARLVGGKLQSTEAYKHRPRGFEKNIDTTKNKLAKAVTRTVLDPVDGALAAAKKADELKAQVRMLAEARAVAGYVGIEPDVVRRIGQVKDFAMADARIGADALRTATTAAQKDECRQRCVSALRMIERLAGPNEAEAHYRKLGVRLV